ncbi:MAG: AzlD domain-containing protein [Pseudomonadota bacterium]
MSTAEVWTLIIGLGVATYLIRFSFLGLLAGRELPPILREALGFVPVAVLPALVAPMVLIQEEEFIADPARIAGALAVILVCALTRNVVGGIAAGLAAFLAIGAFSL